MIKAVVFDLDHTLFDRYATIRKIAPTLKATFKINADYTDVQIAELMCETDKNYVHKGWNVIQEEIEKTDLLMQKLEPDEYRKAVMGEFMSVAVPFPFTIAMLDCLKEKGFKLALITNGNSALQNSKIDMLKIREFFQYIYIGGEHELQKPHVEPFLETALRLGVKPNECVYVGDNPINDVDASRKAGYVPIHVETTENWVIPEIERPKYSVKTVEEIPELIDKINREQI